MSTKPAAEVEIRLDKERAEKEAKGFASNLAQALSGVRAAVDLAKDAWSALSGIVKDSIGAAAEAEKAQAQLSSALRQQTKDYAAVQARLAVFNMELQRSTNHEDDALAAMQAKLSLLGVMPGHLEAATRATIGLSQITGGDLMTSATQVAKVFGGNTEALKKLGIEGASVADVLRQLDRGFSATKAGAQTFSGKVGALSLEWGNLKETIGAAIIDNADLRRALDDLKNWVIDITTNAENGKSKIGGFISETISGLQSLVAFVRDNKTELGVAAGILGAVALANPAARIGAAVGAIEVGRQRIMGRFGKPGDDTRRDDEASAEAERRETIRRIVGAPPDEIRKGRDGPALPEIPLAPSNKQIAEAEKAAKEFERFQQEAQATARRVAKERNDEGMRAFLEQTRRDQDQILLAGEVKEKSVIEAEQRIADAKDFLRKQQLDADEQFNAQMIAIGLGGMSGFISGLTASLIQGKADVGQALVGLLGTILAGVGQSMVALGTAAVAAASATSGIPLLWPIFGGPIGVAGGIALIGAGSVLAGVGQGIAGLGRSSGAPSSPRGASVGTGDRSRSPGAAGRGRGFDSAAPQGFVPSGREREAGPRVTVIVQGIVQGSERGLARELGRILRSGNSLSPGYAGA